MERHALVKCLSHVKDARRPIVQLSLGRGGLLIAQIQGCDAILARMQEMLLGFQADLGGISDEIKHLQVGCCTLLRLWGDFLRILPRSVLCLKMFQLHPYSPEYLSVCVEIKPLAQLDYTLRFRGADMGSSDVPSTRVFRAPSWCRRMHAYALLVALLSACATYPMHVL